MIVIGKLHFVFSVMLKIHRVKGCGMRTEVIPRLMATMMQTGQVYPHIDVLYQGIVCSLG